MLIIWNPKLKKLNLDATDNCVRIMKRYLFLLLLPMLFGCDKENFNNHNPYIENYGFSVDINTNLPLYNNLKYAGNGVSIAGYTTGGIWVFYTGSGYNAFDAQCPNQPLSSCSILTRNGGELTCPCDSVEYSLFTGLSQGTQTEYPLKQYRVEVNGDNIRVYN